MATMALPSLFNGERAVVVLFIARTLYAAPLSLLAESLSLSLLSLFALSVEISVESSSPIAQFSTRPGASSGILLGAVTLPGVGASRLIQLSRALSLQEIGVEELEYVRLQYWAMAASCFSVLVFLCFIFHHPPDNNRSVCSLGDWGRRFSSLSIALFAAVGCVFSAMKFDSGWRTTAMLLWVLCHGFAAVKQFQHVVHTFPACASIGEALLVTSGLVIYFGDTFSCTVAKIYELLIPAKVMSEQHGIKRSETSTIIQGVLLGLLLFPLFIRSLLQVWEKYTSSAPCKVREYHEMGRSVIFYASLVFVLGVIVPSWMQFVQDFPAHPVLWVFDFVFSEPLKRISLCMYWVAVICVSVLRFYNISKNSKIERILLRKYYHLMAVLMFVPALIFQPKFLDLAFGAALAVFLVLEIIRVWRIWPLGHLVNQFMNAFTDHRDSDLLIVSHFSLLLGCALPIWMSSGFNDRPLAPFAGILSLGIGDTMASMVGHKYGVLRWSKTGKKTIEGTAAGITSVLAACSVLLPVLATTGYIFTQHWLSLFLAVTVSGLLEAYTAQLDNAFIPLVFYSLLCL
ncbi:hypothetical protein RJ639_046050 [Escallonia herrerae]|uniref:dolichol kinase n=1 Tax=Escallonia herrerae TaxID=1293975 RepID=A0AA88WAE7_9ASTE|nr:hypothetical protein RJ639_046050 [Escallonia herrerae]